MSTLRAAVLLVLLTATSAEAQPAAVTTASFSGTYSLRGLTHRAPTSAGTSVSTAEVTIRVREGAVEVTRVGSTWVAPGAQRTTRWTSTEAALIGDRLVVTFRPRDEWVTGLVGALEGEGTRVTNENVLRASYALDADGALSEGLENRTLLPPEHFWSYAASSGPALRPADAGPLVKLTTLYDHGPQDARYDLVFVSEGYREDELPRFRADVRAHVARLRATTPFKEYWRYLNVHRVEVASKGTGIPGGHGGGPAALGTKLSGDVNDEWRIPSGSRDAVEGAVRRAGLKRPQAIVVLVNDVLRSVAHTGYTYVCAWDIDARGTRRDPTATTVHELGHVIGFLLDEYEENPASRWDFLSANAWQEGYLNWIGWGPNVTTHQERDRIPWREWLPPRVPLPTAKGSGHAVGLYVGAMHMSRRWHRPSELCMMRGDDDEPFCVVCREAIILRLSQRSRPWELTIRRLDANRVHLQVQTWIPGGGGARWSRNGGFLEVDGGVFLVDRADTPNGDNELELVIGDVTPWVRHDPYEWSLWRVRFTIQKGYLWDKGVKVSGPYIQPKREVDGEELGAKLED